MNVFRQHCTAVGRGNMCIQWRSPTLVTKVVVTLSLIWCLAMNRETPDDFLTFLLLFLLVHLAVSSCLFLFFQHGLSLGRNIIPFFLLNKRWQVRRKLNPWEVIFDREELAVIHTVEHPLGLDVIPVGYQNLRESLNRIPLKFTSTWVRSVKSLKTSHQL